MQLTVGSATLSCQLTPWDERVLGVKSCDITELRADTFEDTLFVFSEFERWVDEQEIGFVQCRVDANSAILRKALEQSGFYFAESSLVLSFNNPKKFDTTNICRIQAELRLPKNAELKAIKRSTRDDFHHGRILEDIRIPSQYGRKRNENWIDALAVSPFTLLVGECRDSTIGFHAERFDEDRSIMHWILTGVNADMSVYALSLWAAAFERAKLLGARRIETTISTANTKVLNLYNQFPFRVETCLFGFHRQRYSLDDK